MSGGKCLYFLCSGKTFYCDRLEPLLARIKEDHTAVLCPEIDLIDKNTLQYGGTGSFSVGGFWWSLHFSWRPIPQHEQRRRSSAISPIRYLLACLNAYYSAVMASFVCDFSH